VIKQTRPLLIATTAAWETHLFLEPTVLLLGRSGGQITTQTLIGVRAATISWKMNGASGAPRRRTDSLPSGPSPLMMILPGPGWHRTASLLRDSVMPEATPRKRVPCEGWWEQVFHGRQPMESLRVAVEGRLVAGEGTDIIGPFTLDGEISDDGRVSLLKDYLGRHSVRYEGQHDGEGRMWGVWSLPGFNGRWMIAFRREPRGDLDDLRQIGPRR